MEENGKEQRIVIHHDYAGIAKNILLALVPRFVTEDVALIISDRDDGKTVFDIACSMEDVLPGEEFDAIATVDAFTWVNVGIPYRVRNTRPWAAPQSGGR